MVTGQAQEEDGEAGGGELAREAWRCAVALEAWQCEGGWVTAKKRRTTSLELFLWEQRRKE